MSASENIQKLMDSINEEDRELAIILLESDEVPYEEKKKFLIKYIEENFTEEEKKSFELWLKTSKNKKLWILKKV